VFRARRDDGRSVVIKRPRDGRPEPWGRERLAHEFDVLRRLDLPGVARPLDLTTLDGYAALVLEDAGCRSLGEALVERPLAIDAFLELAASLARVVSEIHARGVIHRDICPENVVLQEPHSRSGPNSSSVRDPHSRSGPNSSSVRDPHSRSGPNSSSVRDPISAVTLVDFESATAVPTFAEAGGAPGSLGGSLPYMAPESTGRIRRYVDRRTDLYALGATFYAMLAGHPPFVARDVLELVHAHSARAPVPLATVNRAVPVVLSDIVDKLLAKMPEWRYQTAESLVVDLEEARRQWQARREIAPFEPGRHDLPYGLVVAREKLYGRERETALLEAAIAGIERGASQVVLETGVAGIGKSALIRQVQERSRASVRWLSGKGDLLQGNVPHRPLVEAVSGFVQAVLGEGEGAAVALREAVRRATAPNGRVLVDAIPELRTLLGDPPGVPEVGARETENRFRLTFAAFVRALAGAGRAVVFFLDDLQWFDQASLQLVRTIAADREMRSLLVLGAYRSEEVGPEHAVTHFVDSLRADGAPITEVELGPLGADAVLAFVCDSLRVEPDQARKLAELVTRKTAANPFFVRQFLGSLYRDGLLQFDEASGRWSWDLAGIEAAAAAPNIVDLLAKTFGALPDESQQALRAAACIGDRFELGLLAGVRDEPLDATARALWAPLERGLLVPAAEARFEWARGTPVELGAAVAPAFRFVHDRIRQVAYTSLPEGARRAEHLKIGRWLEQHAPAESFDAALETVADQLNRSGEELPEGERLRSASFNERAGRKARAEAAYASALGYFRAGLALLPQGACRGDRHDLWFALLKGGAECAGLTGEHALSEGLVERGLSQTEAVLEQAALRAIGILTNHLRGRNAEALRHARDGLAALGVDLPDRLSSEIIRGECERAQTALRRRTDAHVLRAPPSGDPVDRARLKLLLAAIGSSWLSDPSGLHRVLSCRAAALASTMGSTPGSATAYVHYASVLAQHDEYGEAYRYGRLAVALSERIADAAERSHVLFLLALHVNAWRAPVAENLPLLQRSCALGMESGALDLAGFAQMQLIMTRIFMGAELGQTLIEAQAGLAEYRKLHHATALFETWAHLQAIKCLMGLTRDRATFDDDEFDEARHLSHPGASGASCARFYILRLQVGYLLGQMQVARTYAARSAEGLEYLGPHFVRTSFDFYAALTLARIASGAGPPEREALLSRLREYLGRLETWSNNAPMNFQHKRDLVAAELARAEDRPVEALASYNGAIEGAGRHEFPHEEALAHELCGRFHHERGAGRLADLHLVAAIQGYSAWGATAKVTALEEEFPSLRSGREPRYISAPRDIDYLTVVKAAETLTEELEFDRLLEKLVRTCSQSAGAQRVVVVLDEGGLVVRATLAAASDVVLERKPLASSAVLPESLVRDVFASRSALALADAARAGRYRTDPYVSAHGVRSVLALPIVRGDRALGVLYFENNLASDAFPPARVEMLGLLSATIAIAIENSRLFEERRRSENALALLAKASAELVGTLDYEEVLSKLASLVVPAFADWAVVHVTEDGTTTPASWAHADPDAASCVEELYRRYPIDPSSEEATGRVLRSGTSMLFSEVTEEQIRSYTRDEEERRLVRALNPRSTIICPLVARGRGFGVVTLVSSHPTRRYDASDLALAEELVRRAGLAVDNARLHRNLQKTLRERERAASLLQATIEATADGIVVVDADRNVTVHNRRLLDMWGIPAALADGEERRLFEPALDQVDNADAFVAGMDERYADPEREHIDRVVFRDGRIFERYSRPQRLGDTVVGRVWSFRDISERERLLRRALFLSDATRLLASLDVDSALQSVARLAVPSMADRCAIDLLGDGEARRFVAHAEGDGRPIPSELHPKVLEGQSVGFSSDGSCCLGIPILVKGDRVGALTLCAAPHRSYAQSDLELAEEVARRAALSIDNARLYQNAQEALRARDDLLAIAAHEIRGPLNAIHMSIQGIRRAKNPAQSEPKLLDIIEREDQRLAGFVAELLEIGRIRGGSFRLEREPVDLSQIVQQVVARLRSQSARTGSSVAVQSQGNVVGDWDKARLDEVVDNLLSNAIKFGRGKPIEITVVGHDSRVELTIKDQGTGIDCDMRRRLFEPFERGVSLRHHGGLGMGLFIVRTIVNGLGGSVRVESEVNVGSTFVVELPKSQDGEERHQDRASR
jgi:predicted ATPase/signal transduction histidine kinase